MGPTNIALVKLFQADQQFREAQGRLDAAGKNVRVQERRVAELNEKLAQAQAALREQQAKSGELELDVKTRDARIERLREQQQVTKNNKEYQTFLIEINTEKVDRGKSEDLLIGVMEIVEKSQESIKELSAVVDSENARLAALHQEIGGTLAKLQTEVDALRPARAAAAEAVPPRMRDTFERLAERFEGEALSPIEKPDRRREEYACGACNMDLVTDVYNKLHSRDDLVYCPSCGRMLFIPEDLPVEQAVHSRGKERKERDPLSPSKPRGSRAKATVKKLDLAERQAKGKIGELLAGAQGESVKTAFDAGVPAVECDVFLDGKFMGVYKGRTREHLERVVQFRMEESQVTGKLEVRDKAVGPASSHGEFVAGSRVASEPQPQVPTQPSDDQPKVDPSVEPQNVEASAHKS